MLTEAFLLDRDLSLRQGQRDVPPPRPGELVVRVEWAGVCASDLHALRTGGSVGYWPATLGSEVAGTVDSCPGGELPRGCRVVIDPRVPCGACPGCARAPGRCTRPGRVGEARPGGFAGLLLVDADRVVQCPDGLEAALAVLAEPLAEARHAVRRVAGPPGRAAILGYGPVGMLVHLEITRCWPGADVAVVETVPSRRELASALGAEVTSRAELESSGRRCDVVIDMTRCLVAGSAGASGELTASVAALSSDPERYRPVVTESVLLDEAPARLRELTGSPSAGKVLIRP